MKLLWIALFCVPYVWFVSLTPLLGWRELLTPVRYFKTEAVSEEGMGEILARAREYAPGNPFVHLYMGMWQAMHQKRLEAKQELELSSKLGNGELGDFFELVFLPCVEGCDGPPVSREELSRSKLSPADALRLAPLPLWRREMDIAAKMIGRAAYGETKNFDFQRQAGVFEFLRGELRSASEHLERAWMLHAAAKATPSFGLGFVPYRFHLIDEGRKLRGEFSPWMGTVTTSHRELQESSAETLYNLAVLFRHADNYRRSLYLAQLLAKEYPSEVASMQLEEMLDRYLYPRNYAAEVESCSTRYNVDPYLIYALIREESHYEASSISPAGALGLMQLMPLTGRWIASRLKMLGFQDKALLQPLRNIELGSWYLSHLTQQLPAEARQVDWLLAAYNGGPANVGLWVAKWKKAGGEPIESIAFSETRDYVTKVKKSYESYRRIWSVPGPVRPRG